MTVYAEAAKRKRHIAIYLAKLYSKPANLACRAIHGRIYQKKKLQSARKFVLAVFAHIFYDDVIDASLKSVL